MKSRGILLALVVAMTGFFGCKTPGNQSGSELRDAASTQAAMQQCNFFLSQKDPAERRKILEFLLELMTTTRSKEIQARVGLLYDVILRGQGEADFYEALKKRGLIDAEGNLKPEAEARFVSEMFAQQEGQFRLAQEAALKLVESYRGELEAARGTDREKLLETIKGDMEALAARTNVGGYREVEAGQTDVVDRAVRAAGRMQAEAIAEEVFAKMDVITNESRREGGYTMEVFRRNILGSAHQAALETFLANPTEGSFETFAQTINASRRRAGLAEARNFERYRTYVDEREIAGLRGRLEGVEVYDEKSAEALKLAKEALEAARNKTFTDRDREALRSRIGAETVFERLKVKEVNDPGFRDRRREREATGRARF